MSDACLPCLEPRCEECADIRTPDGALCRYHAEELRAEANGGVEA